MAFHIIKKKGEAGSFFVFFSGVMAGYSYLLRFIGVTLILSIAAGLVLSIFLKIIPVKGFIKTARFYFFGILLVVIPYFVRNIVVLKSILPAGVSAYEVPWLTTVHVYFQELAAMIFINRSFDIIVLMLMVGFAVCFTVYARTLTAPQ